MDPLFEIELPRGVAGTKGATRKLLGWLREAIVSGRLQPGAKLPATRKSASLFGVSRNTIAGVYELLTLEGHVVSRRGSGHFVADKLASTPEVARRDGAAPIRTVNPFWLEKRTLAAMSFLRDPPRPHSSGGPEIDFRPALVDSRLFPFDVFRRVGAKRLRALERKPARLESPQGNQGHYYLRKAITEHIGLTRAVVCGADDVLVTSGAQQAFDLLARVLVTSGETVVAVEDPGYPPMRVAFAAAGARIVAAPVDEEGLVVDALPKTVHIVCVTPSHQFPLGVTMSARRRKSLLDFARAHGAVVVEDDYDGEFRFDGGSLEALRTGASADIVCYVGTFSKSMLPALRLGYIVAPAWAMGALTSAKNCLDWHCSTLLQMQVAGFIAEGHLSRHVRKLRQIYAKRRKFLVQALSGDLSKFLTPIPSTYGMHIAAIASTGLDVTRLADAVADRNVRIHTLDRYYIESRPLPGLIFGYGTVDMPALERGLECLRAAIG